MTNETSLWVIEFLLGLVVAGLAWWCSTMWGELKSINTRLEARDKEYRERFHAQNDTINKLNLVVVGGYVTREELRDSMREMTAAVTTRIDKLDDKMAKQIDGIHDELKQKVDKP